MRPVSGLLFAVVAATLIVACGESEDGLLSEQMASPSATTVVGPDPEVVVVTPPSREGLPPPADDWFTHEEHLGLGMAYRYPPDWFSSSSGFKLFSFDPELVPCTECRPTGGVIVDVGTAPADVAGAERPPEASDIQIAGVPGWELLTASEAGIRTHRVVLLSGEDIYSMLAIYDESTPDETTFLRIVESIRITPSFELATYVESQYEYSFEYPAFWEISEVTVDDSLAGFDILSGVEFLSKSGLARASLYTYQNPEDLPLEEWILGHNVIFFDYPPVDVTIGGIPGLLAPLNFQGLPSPLAYVKHGAWVFSIKGLTNDDYQEIVSDFRLTGSAELTYVDPEYGFSLRYPAFWAVSEVPLDEDQIALDALKRVDFVGKGGLPRFTVFVGNNPDDLSLVDWLRRRNPIFLDTPPEEVTIDGVPALFQPLSLGLPRPQSYVKVGSIVLSFSALMTEDYEAVISTLRFE